MLVNHVGFWSSKSNMSCMLTSRMRAFVSARSMYRLSQKQESATRESMLLGLALALALERRLVRFVEDPGVLAAAALA